MTETNGQTHQPDLASASLLLAADYLDDVEKVRLATANRVRSLRDVKGATGTPELGRWEEQLEVLKEIETFAVHELQRAMRVHPLGPFVKATVGLGDKQAARLLASTGDLAARPNVAKVWAYCGLHVVEGKAPKLKRGVQANWNTEARMRAYLVAESCMKQRGSPYRDVYDKARERWADRDTSDGHKHLHALRVVAKAVLRDMWVESRKQAGLPHNKNRRGTDTETKTDTTTSPVAA